MITNRIHLASALAATVVLSCHSAFADKADYHFFNPTPRAEMRELSPDRPDATESPLTVDAGHYAVEVSLFDWRRNDGADAYTVMATNFKIGLTNDIDFQTVFDLYSWEDPVAGSGLEGFGDVQFRLKWNLWGNDGGDSALALFPFIKVPTGTQLSNGEVEGGLIIPFGMSLTDRLGIGIMPEIDYVYNADTDGYDVELVHTVVLGYEITEKVGGFLEYIGVTGEDTPYSASLAGGFTYSVNDDLTLDIGSQVGLNDNAEDFGLFTGFTRRF